MPEGGVTEVTRQSWFSRLGGAFKGVLFGFILILLGLWLLFWNEGRTVRRAKALDEGAGVVTAVAADRVDTANEGRLVHLSGTAATFDVLQDEVFGVRENAIRLERSSPSGLSQLCWASSSPLERRLAACSGMAAREVRLGR